MNRASTTGLSRTGLSRNQSRGLWFVLIVAVLICIFMAFEQERMFFAAWLAAAMWLWSICTGALALRLILGLTGGRWGSASLPWLNALVRLLPLTSLLFIPWAFGLNELYSWAHKETFAGLKHVEHRQWYFQPGFVIARTVGYFIIWSGLALLVSGRPAFGRSFVEDCSRTALNVRGGQAVAGLGLVVLLMTVTWAAMDWVMSLDPFFMSTLFGAMVGMGAMLSGLAMLVAMYCQSLPERDSGTSVPVALPHLANLLLAFVMLWAYLSFSQFLIMWSADLPREAFFYQVRDTGAWHFITLALVLGGFIIPFVCLMSHDFKRSAGKVRCLALALVVVRLVELWWMTVPYSAGQARSINWAMLPTAIAAGTGWLLLTDGRPLFPQFRSEGDPSGTSGPKGGAHV